MNYKGDEANRDYQKCSESEKREMEREPNRIKEGGERDAMHTPRVHECTERKRSSTQQIGR